MNSSIGYNDNKANARHYQGQSIMQAYTKGIKRQTLT